MLKKRNWIRRRHLHRREHKVKAETEASVAIERARGEAEANRLLSESVTDELIRLKEAEANAKEAGRTRRTWIRNRQGADSVVVDDE